jgi:hypothetical protein
MSREFAHILMAAILASVLVSHEQLCFAQETLTASLLSENPEENSFPLFAPVDSTTLFQPIEPSYEAAYSPLYMPEMEHDYVYGPGQQDTGAAGGSAGLLQPSIDAGCAVTCEISPGNASSSHSTESGLGGQRTTALVIGTMGAALSAMLVTRAGRAPSWHGADMLPLLAIGPTGGLYIGIHVGVPL